LKIAGYLLLLFILCLILAGCTPKADYKPVLPTAPNQVTLDQADWLLSLRFSNNPAKSNLTDITATYLLENEPPAGLIQLDVNGTMLTMVADSITNMYIIPDYPLTPGANHSLRFFVNHQLLGDAEIRAVYRATVSFPEILHPNQSITLQWQVGRNNQYQVVQAITGKGNQMKQYSKTLDASLRNLTIPGSALPDYGSQTSYKLSITQVNYKVENRIAFMFWEEILHSYIR
jgi:hypothetical protein